MEKKLQFQEQRTSEELSSKKTYDRRKFLSYLGLSASVITVAACTKTQSTLSQNSPASDALSKNLFDKKTVVDLGSGDIGILNYAYALEQLEAAFYTQVVASFYTGVDARERQGLQDIYYHEVAHREFFKTALGSSAIQALTPDFSSVDFTSRTSVLTTAKAFEDLGVSAYNGAGKLITNPDYLLLAGKIVSVEARHAAFIRDLINYNSFADDTVLDSNGLDTSRDPKQVISISAPYIMEKLNGDNLPKH